MCIRTGPQPLENFSRPYKHKTMLYARCKKCRAKCAAQSRKDSGQRGRWNYRLLRCYGITAEVVEQMYEQQGRRCAICFVYKELNTNLNTDSLHVDHDHSTGMVRGLLCYACNLGLGHMKDSGDLLRSAISYLEKHT